MTNFSRIFFYRIKVNFLHYIKWTINTQTNTQTWYFIAYDLHSLSWRIFFRCGWCMMLVWNMTVTVSIVVCLFLHKNFHTFCLYSLDASWLVTLQFYWPKLLKPALLSNWILSNNQIYILYTYHNHLIFNWAGSQTHH